MDIPLELVGMIEFGLKEACFREQIANGSFQEAILRPPREEKGYAGVNIFISTKRVQTSTTGTRYNARTINTFFFPGMLRGTPGFNKIKPSKTWRHHMAYILHVASCLSLKLAKGKPHRVRTVFLRDDKACEEGSLETHGAYLKVSTCARTAGCMTNSN